MPELPEVETTRRGVLPYCSQQKITDCIVRDRRLRWPIPKNFGELTQGQTIQNIQRRGKYLIFQLDDIHVLWHLGMSGSLRVVTRDALATGLPEAVLRKHDHVDWVLDNQHILRFHDPRRFGSIHVVVNDPLAHPLLTKLGPEPLSANFTATTLFTASRGRKVPVKNLIMNSHIVVGVGNIYASEALFMAGIHPLKAAGKVSQTAYARLVTAIKTVLSASIEQGGTTLRDFVNSNGEPGYFKQQLRVYERAGQPCITCSKPITKRVIGQRSSYYCNECQK